MTKGIQQSLKKFHWEITTNLQEFEDAIGVFKIFASSEECPAKVDLRWADPISFLKDGKKKEKVWQDIHELVMPALAKSVVKKEALKLTDGQLQQLLGMITDSNVSFELDHPDGFVIGVNKTVGVDLSLTTGDLASMLVASWLFKTGGIRLNLA